MSKVCPLCGELQRYELDAGFGCASCERKRKGMPSLAEVVKSIPADTTTIMHLAKNLRNRL